MLISHTELLLNEWAQKQYEYSIGSNGICTENFFVDVPWQINRDTYESKTYLLVGRRSNQKGE